MACPNPVSLDGQHPARFRASWGFAHRRLPVRHSNAIHVDLSSQLCHSPSSRFEGVPAPFRLSARSSASFVLIAFTRGNVGLSGSKGRVATRVTVDHLVSLSSRHCGSFERGPRGSRFETFGPSGVASFSFRGPPASRFLPECSSPSRRATSPRPRPNEPQRRFDKQGSISNGYATTSRAQPVARFPTRRRSRHHCLQRWRRRLLSRLRARPIG